MSITKPVFKRKIFLAVSFAVTVLVSFADGAFEYSGRAAREEGMGGSYVALADDASAVFHNPAGLSNISIPELLTGYGGLFMGLDDGSLTKSLITAVYPFSSGIDFLDEEGAGVGWSRLSAAGLYREDAFVMGYGARVTDSLRAGIGLKILSVGYGEDEYTKINPVFSSGYGSTAFSADLGIIYNLLDTFAFGFGVYNINSPDIGLKHENRVPRYVKGGTNLSLPHGNIGMQLEYGGGDTTFSIGAEHRVLNSSFLARGGLGLGSRQYRTASLGVSYSIGRYNIDYSFLYPLTGIVGTLGTHKINAAFYFGDKYVPEPEPEVIEAVVLDELPDEVAPRVISEADIRRSRDLTSEAEEMIDRGNFVEAFRTLEQAKNIWGDNRAAENLLGDLGPVVNIYDSVVERDKKTSLVARAVRAYFDGRGREALNRIRYASQLWPDDVSLQQLRSVIERKFSQRASEEKLIPGLNLVEQRLQEILEAIYERRWVRAVSLCEEVLDLEPDNVLALKRMGSAYFGMGNRQKATEIWERALEIDPNDKELLEYLGISEAEPVPDIVSQREFESAVNYYNRIVEAGAGDDVRIQVLERIITTYRDTEINISSLEEELNRLRERR